MKIIITILAGLLFTTTVSAQKNKSVTGLIYGTDYAFLLTAPKGWALDDTSGQGQRLSVVFYPKGESWKDAVTVMYGSTWTLKQNETINDIIKADLAKSLKAHPGTRITQKPNVKLENNLVAHIREIQGGKDGNYETIAYISQQNFIVLIVMTSRNKKDSDKKMNKFYELVKSYRLSKQK